MTATNGNGYEIQVYNKAFGWVTETKGFADRAAASLALWGIKADGRSRRVYESLEGH